MCPIGVFLVEPPSPRLLLSLRLQRHLIAFGQIICRLVPLASSNEVEFLYVDAAEMDLGAEHNIVILLTDCKTVDDVSMIVECMESLQEIEPYLGTCDVGAALFSFAPPRLLIDVRSQHSVKSSS